MLLKIELHRDVIRFIRHDCSEQERTAFYRMVNKLREEPIRHSEHMSDPRMSRYMLRFSRFGANFAVFQYDLARKRIRIVTCHKAPPRRSPVPKPNDAEDER